MTQSTKCRIFLFLLFITLAFTFFLVIYTCTGNFCFGFENTSPTSYDDYKAFVHGKLQKHKFTSEALNKQRKLDLEGQDVLVYLHIQKTGGATFGRHLVHNLDVDPPCECVPHVKQCKCLTKNNRFWLFSRHAVGWQCGLHADWTELNDCVYQWFKTHDDESRTHRRYHFLTFLRDPVNRFLSEWQHTRRGATWKSARLHCNGRDASLSEVPFCYHGPDWTGVSFEDFIACKHNLAFNRMTRMLANLSLVNCYNRTGLSDSFVEETLLKSAKENLLTFAFFGIVEEQEKTQFLFEKTLMGLRFIKNFKQKEQTHVARLNISEDRRKKVIEKNKLDVRLYQFAKDLFLQRVSELEKKLGYSVKEYFDHFREEYEEEDDDYLYRDEEGEEEDENERNGERESFHQSQQSLDILLKNPSLFSNSQQIDEGKS